jgi:hypothetical protein
LDHAPRLTTFTQTIKGYLIAVDQDGDDGPGQIAVLAEDDTEYVVDDTERGRRLLRHMDDKVLVWGPVREDDQGTRYIRVAGFEVVTWNEP